MLELLSPLKNMLCNKTKRVTKYVKMNKLNFKIQNSSFNVFHLDFRKLQSPSLDLGSQEQVDQSSASRLGIS